MKMPLQLLTLLWLLLHTLDVSADTFEVTSTADTGPGSLREAVTQAGVNGKAVTDYIHFNLTDITIAGRTIILRSALPDLSSNLVIDGSTQPGVRFGLSDAKVLVIGEYSAGTPQHLFNMVSQDRISIYGLKIDNRIIWTAFYPDCFAIYIDNCTNIEIGNVGKGNVITKWQHAIRVFNTIPAGYSRNIRIYSNFIGVEEDGVTTGYANNGNAITVWAVQNLEIGGIDPAQGNLIAGSRKRIEVRGTYSGTVLVANNKIGTNYFGTGILSQPYGEANHIWDNIYIESTAVYNSYVSLDATVRIINNLSSGYCRSGVYLYMFTSPFIIQGNKFGTDISGTLKLTDGMDYGIRIEGCKAGLIGQQTDIGERNIIAYGKLISSGETYLAGSGIAITNTTGITISRNSMFCNQNVGIGIDRSVPEIPIVGINNETGTLIAGSAPANAKIEVFEDDECPGCEGKTYLTTIMADANGKWSYDNAAARRIVVTATTPAGETTEFSAPRYTRTPAFRIKPASCGRSNGSITGLAILSGTSWYWEDDQGRTVGTDTTVTNLAPGRYRLVIGLSTSSCDLKTDFITIDQINPPPTVIPVMRPAVCGLANGSLSASYDYYSFSAIWKDPAGATVGTGTVLNTAPPGDYFLQLTAIPDNTCLTNFGPFAITNASGPSLVTGSMQIVPASCGNKNGSIKSLGITGATGTVFILWLDSSNQVVPSTGFSINNQSAGTYHMKLKDQSTCDTIRATFIIPETNPAVRIDINGLRVSPSACNSPTGSVTGLSVTGATSYTWTDAAGSVKSTLLQPAGLGAGRYVLHASNADCTQQTDSVTIPIRPPVLDESKTYTTANTCEENNGGIQQLVLTSNTGTFPFTYNWLNASSNNVGQQLELTGMPAGNYHLIVLDAAGCSDTSRTYIIADQAILLATPSYDDLVIPKGTVASLVVRNPGDALYTLYESNTFPSVLDQNMTGRFTTPVLTTDKVYTIMAKRGTCVSDPEIVSVRVVDKTSVHVPNGFSPNRDGKNDVLKPIVRGYLNVYRFVVYGRWGDVLFQSINPANGWDGMVNGTEAPTGTYVWILSGTDLLGAAIRQQGSVVLVR